jgi:acyl-coenzyme A thioesterase PaaI-like protein
MRFDFGLLAEKLEKASPKLAKTVSIKILNLVSPFNGHLKASVKDWTNLKASLKVKNHRSVKNHLGGIHAGALFTLGETCAGFVILKNFSFGEYRPIMSEINVVFTKQARDIVTGTCVVTKSNLARARGTLKEGKAAYLPMVTTIVDGKGETVAEVKTRWQIKSWKQVRVK